MDAISFSLPGDNGSDFHDADWSVTDTKLANLPVLRLSAGYINPQGKPDPLAKLYFVEDKTAFLRGRYHYSAITVFNDLQPFGEKRRPQTGDRREQCRENRHRDRRDGAGEKCQRRDFHTPRSEAGLHVRS